MQTPESYTERIEHQLAEAVKLLKQQKEFIDSLSEPPRFFGFVVGITASGFIVSSKEGVFETVATDNIAEDIELGHCVYLYEGRIVEISKNVLDVGNMGVIRSVDGSICEVEVDGSLKSVYCFGEMPEAGDRVVVDSTNLVITKNFGSTSTQYSFKQETNVSWDDIGGLEEAKQILREAIEYPLLYKESYKRYGKKSSRGVLLYGPPGNGKTMLGKAAATAVAKIYGQTATTGFFYVKGPEILNMYVGESEAIIRRLFAACKKHKNTTGYPAVLFIDEADAILSKRGSNKTSYSDLTIVPMFLAEMDGMEDSGAFVILATNRSDVLDPAVVRDGRCDRKALVSRPNEDSAKNILKIHLQNRPFDNTNTELFADKVIETMYSADHVLYEAQLESGKIIPITAKHFVNGAMLAGIVERAIAFAINREIHDAGTTGITIADAKNAARASIAELRGLNHQDEIREALSASGIEDVVGLRTIRLDTVDVQQ